jgi:hypothetical protein
MRMIALKQHVYGGKNRQVHDRFEARDEDVPLLGAMGLAAPVDEPGSPEAEAAPPPRTKRTYRRRDLKAEDA